MTRTKETIDWDAIADHNELDEWLSPEELSEDDLMRLHLLTLKSEVDDLLTRMQKQLDRCRYYGESVDTEEFDFLHRELQRIRKVMG